MSSGVTGVSATCSSNPPRYPLTTFRRGRRWLMASMANSVKKKKLKPSTCKCRVVITGTRLQKYFSTRHSFGCHVDESLKWVPDGRRPVSVTFAVCALPSLTGHGRNRSSIGGGCGGRQRPDRLSILKIDAIRVCTICHRSGHYIHFVLSAFGAFLL